MEPARWNVARKSKRLLPTGSFKGDFVSRSSLLELTRETVKLDKKSLVSSYEGRPIRPNKKNSQVGPIGGGGHGPHDENSVQLGKTRFQTATHLGATTAQLSAARKRW